MCKIISFLVATLLSIDVLAKDITSPEELLQQYIELGDNFDPSVANLYSDRAKIMVFRKYPHGSERQMELSGLQWKSLLSKMMPAAKAVNDISTYKDIEILKVGRSFKVKANRYSERKCYLDTGYYMVIEPSDSGGLLITEEYMETQPESNCVAK